MLFRAEVYGLGHARTGKICGNMTFQDGRTFMGCDSNQQTSLCMKIMPARVWRCVLL